MRHADRLRVLSLIIIGSLCLAPQVATADDKLSLKVSGMVCSFCAQGIRKNFEKQPEIQAVDVNLDEHRVDLQLKDKSTLDEAKIRSILEQSGYNLLEIHQIKDSSNPKS